MEAQLYVESISIGFYLERRKNEKKGRKKEKERQTLHYSADQVR